MPEPIRLWAPSYRLNSRWHLVRESGAPWAECDPSIDLRVADGVGDLPSGRKCKACAKVLTMKGVVNG